MSYFEPKCSPNKKLMCTRMVQSACTYYKCAREVHTAYTWQEFSCKQLSGFPGCVGKKSRFRPVVGGFLDQRYLLFIWREDAFSHLSNSTFKRLTPWPFKAASWLVLPQHLCLTCTEVNVVITSPGSSFFPVSFSCECPEWPEVNKVSAFPAVIWKIEGFLEKRDVKCKI